MCVCVHVIVRVCVCVPVCVSDCVSNGQGNSCTGGDVIDRRCLLSCGLINR